jgi:hypothetical protein
VATVMLASVASALASDKPCLRVGYIHNWEAASDKVIIVEDDWRKKFRLSLIGVCNDLKYHYVLSFRAIGGTALTCLSVGDQVISHEFGIGREPCTVTQIEAYTPEMESTDRQRKRHRY